MKREDLKTGIKLTIGFGTIASLLVFAAVRMDPALNAFENNKTDNTHSTELADAIIETKFESDESELNLVENIFALIRG